MWEMVLEQEVGFFKFRKAGDANPQGSPYQLHLRFE